MESIFVNISFEEVASLRKEDPLVAKISGKGKSLNFSWLRKEGMRDLGIKDSLKWGTAIPGSTPQLDQYLYTYGKMVKSQWDHVTSKLNYKANSKNDTLIDCGCGQGLAGLCLHDNFGRDFLNSKSHIVLIEPSATALIRAEAIYRAISPKSQIVCINKSFDELESSDFEFDLSPNRLHIYSNVLDIPDFDHIGLFLQCFSIGSHTVLAVGHDRDHNGGTVRIAELDNLLRLPAASDYFAGVESILEQFNCGDNGQFPAVYWAAKFEVINV